MRRIKDSKLKICCTRGGLILFVCKKLNLNGLKRTCQKYLGMSLCRLVIFGL